MWPDNEDLFREMLLDDPRDPDYAGERWTSGSNRDPNNYNVNRRGPDLRAMATKIINELSDLGAYIFNYSVTTNSIYIKFEDEDVRSLTLRDHKTKPKYRYKWNLVMNYRGERRKVDNGVPRYFYNPGQWQEMCKHIRNYQKKVVGKPAREAMSNIPRLRKRG